MKKRLAVLGSTGSIGRTCLQIAARQPQSFEVVALAAGSQWKLLREQVLRFRPKLVSVGSEESAGMLGRSLGDDAPRIYVGAEGLEAVATCPGATIVVNGLSGGVGVRPTVAAIRAGKDVALANKEVIVIAGEVLSRETKEYGSRLLPVDSEISAIWQCLEAGERAAVRRILLTASGGAFRDLSAEELRHVTPEQALSHPTWVMGQKVTIDSASLMNKGFEILEVHWLFDVPLDRIEVLIHHQSIIHSLVEYADGSLIAQLGVPDMTLPIQYGLTYPERLPSEVRPLDLVETGALTFDRPDVTRFPALALARQAAEAGGTMPAVLSGADEIAVQAFLGGRVSFTGIPALVEETMSRHAATYGPSLEELLAAEAWAQTTAASLIDETSSAVASGRSASAKGQS